MGSKQQQPLNNSSSSDIPHQGKNLVRSLQDFDRLQPKYKDMPFKNIQYKILMAISTVILSEQIAANTIIHRTISKIVVKNMKDEETRKGWINRQVSQISKKMIRYNSIAFSSKIILDEYYKQEMQKNTAYYHSNMPIHYKIGALVGVITYFTNLPLAQYQNIHSSNSRQSQSRIQIISNNLKEFFSSQTLKKLLINMKFTSLFGVVIYRMIYFGGYQKIKQKYQHPINQYFIAPLTCSTLGLIVSPLDQIRLLQLTSHKDKSFFQILHQKKNKLWNISNQKIYSSVLKQSLSMVFFLAGQNFVKKFISSQKKQ